MTYARLGIAARFGATVLGKDRPNHSAVLSLVIIIMGSGKVSDLLRGNKAPQCPRVSQTDGSTRGGVNKTPQGGILPRKSRRPGQKNYKLESTAMCS